MWKSPNFKVLLASSSPRRAELVSYLGVDWSQITSTWEEPHSIKLLYKPHEYVVLNALGKAISAAINEPGCVVSADTVCVLPNEETGTVSVLEKPTSKEEARKMIEMLSGRTHTALTGLVTLHAPDVDSKIDHSFDDHGMPNCILPEEENKVFKAILDSGHEITVSYRGTKTTLDNLSKETIDWYVDTGEGMDKAGAYGIQGAGAALVSNVDGCYHNVMGLPLNLLSRALNSHVE